MTKLFVTFLFSILYEYLTIKITMSVIHVYYRYFSDGSPFYYDPSTEVSTFQFPDDGIVLDPETKMPIDNFENPDYQLMINEYKKLIQQQEECALKAQSTPEHQEEEDNDEAEDKKQEEVNQNNENEHHQAVKVELGKYAEDDTVINQKIQKREKTMKRKDLMKHHRSHCYMTAPLDGMLGAEQSIDKVHKKHKKKKDKVQEHPAQEQSSQESILIDVPEAVANFDEKKVSKSITTNRTNSFMPDEKAPYLPNDIQENIHKFQVEDYAKQYFREHRVGKVFSRKLISLDQITQFSKDPLEFSLIKLSSPSDEKNAVKCFKLILGYTGVIYVKVAGICADQLVQIMTNNPCLHDEVYFQLIKQTRHNPNIEWELKTWELFLIITTIFPSSRNSENWIKSHLAQNLNSPNRTIAEYAQLSYIRFSARCAIGKPKTNLELNYSVKIPKQITQDYCPFVSSIYEHLWFQRKAYPNVKIPMIVHKMATAILEKGAENTEGIFRLPGNMKLVQEMIVRIGKGEDPLQEAKLHDVLSLFKQWFRDLPNPTCPVESLPYLKTAHETQTYLDFVSNHIPPAHLNLLGYLIGFLQRLVKSAEITKMNSKNMAIVFAPNIVQPSVDINEPTQIKEYSEISISFLKFLIDNWDVSNFYPLK